MMLLTTMVLGPDANTQMLKHIKLFPIDERSAVAVFITSSGHTENRIFQFDDIVAIDDIEVCANILNDRLSGTLIGNVVEKLNDLEPILAANVKHHEALFQAFINAFINFSQSNTPYISGKNNMLYQPEFNDIEKVRKVMNMLENKSIWRQYEQREKHEKNGVNVSIGDNLIEIDDVSVVSSSFRLGNAEEGKLMVVGPKRMAYDKVIGMMEYMTKTIEELFSDENKEN